MILRGDQSHFVHSEEVVESWRIVDDLLCVGECPIRTVPYIHKGGWGPQHKVSFHHRLGLSRMTHFAAYVLNNPITLGLLCIMLVFVPVLGMWAVHKYHWEHWEPFTKKHK